MRKSGKHTWTEDDEIIGFYLYRFGDGDLPFSKQELADLIGMGHGSMGYKVGNFKALDTDGGLTGYSHQCRRVYERYRDTPDDEFRRVGMEAMTRRLGDRAAALSARRAA